MTAHISDIACGSGADRHPDHEAPHPFHKRNLIAWALANSVGLSVTLAIPLWIGTFAARLGLPSWTAGAAATMELIAASLSNVVWALLRPRFPRRKAIAALALGISSASQLAAFSSPLAAVSGLLLSGIFAGCLLSVWNKQVAVTECADRNYAILVFLHVGFGVIFFLIAPRLQERYGSDAVFQFLSAVALLGAPAMAFLPTHANARASAATRRRTPLPLPSLLGLIALVFLVMGLEVVNAYILLLGQPLGLTRVQVGTILALASTVGLLGPIAAGLLPASIGYLPPICAGLMGMAAVDLSLLWARTSIMFGAGIVAVQTLSVFVVPRLFGCLAMLDSSGRAAGMAPAALLIGASLGPVLGSLVGAPLHAAPIPLAACGTALVALLLMAVIGGKSRPAATAILAR